MTGIIFVVVITIFTPVGVLIDEFLNVEDTLNGGEFNYRESCGITGGSEASIMVSIATVVTT